MGQLRDIAQREGIKVDDDAVAMLAEAGDGSMRDALSIMDQAIACCGEKLTGDVVRGLIGSVPSETLEAIMDAVARNASEDVMRLVDRLITEGQSPAHFARQLVRFLRNATVAKVAGGESPLLQISADERARVGRVATQFSEEDLARFLQIMLRTHGELGYRQEQRFHLELGLLKLVHAQRLLPLEQVLSGAGDAPRATPAAAQPRGVPATASRPPAGPSPFAADRARKGGSAEPESANPFRRDMSVAQPAPAMITTSPVPAMEAQPAPAIKAAPEPQLVPAESLDALRERVLATLEDAGQHMLAIMLGEGEWALNAADVTVKVPKPQSMLDMSFGPEARKLASSAASGVLGRAAKVVLTSGTPANIKAGSGARTPAASPGGVRGRALEDPVVRRMKDKFGAEIRTIIDHRERK